MEISFKFKIIIIGDPSVGKTSLLYQYLGKGFSEDYRATIGTNILVKDIEVDVEKVYKIRLVAWDLAGQDVYNFTRPIFYKSSAGAILMYDMTNEESFNEIKNFWQPDFKNFSDKGVKYILIGNKNDLVHDRKITTEQGKAMADSIEASSFIETSAKTGDNVKQAIEDFVKALVRDKIS